MDFGNIAVIVGLAASAISVASYALANRGSRKALAVGRLTLALTAAAVFGVFGRLLWIVYNHQFQFAYVMQHTDQNLVDWRFRISAAWAGQEGSFVLWLFWTAVIGLLLAWKAGKWEARVMPVYISTFVFLFAILIWLSPFALIPRGSGPNDYPLNLPWPPQFGRGLNPSLQNYWMAIHPPTIFFGFAALAVPFCYAVASLLWREYETWAPRVMPYVLLATSTLGIGLFMGGYWAYETQGWHGFWAWDPVENASLFPWLGCLGLLHGLVVQKSRGGMGRTNLFLAIFSWNLFLYGTFLTRSGVMSEFSVHSFASLENKALYILLGLIGTHMVAGLGLLAWRWKRIPGRPISDKLLSRDTAMVLAVTLMIAMCVVTAIGTSWPMISQWKFVQGIPGLKSLTSARGVAAQPIFYNKIGAMLAIPTLLMMGAVPFLAWGKTNVDKFLWKVIVPWLAAIGIGVLILLFTLGQVSPDFTPDTPRTLVVALGTLGVFAALANLMLAVKLLRVKAVTLGGWLAHVGIGVLITGTVLTNVYERTFSFTLLEGLHPVKTPFGYSVQFAGWTHDGLTKAAEEAGSPEEAARLSAEARQEWWKFEHGVRVTLTPIASGPGVAHADAGDETPSTAGSFTATLPVFKTTQQAMNSDPEAAKTMRWPYIHKELARDLYILVANDPKLLRVSATVTPGETQPVMGTNYKVHYKRFYMEGSPGQPGTTMGAEMDLITPEGKRVPIRPGMRFTQSGQPAQANVDIPAVRGAVILDGGIDPASKRATVAFELPDAPAFWGMPVSVTNKPWINLVWLGVLLMGAGTMFAMVRRAQEARKGVLIAARESAGVPDGEPVVPAGAIVTEPVPALAGAGAPAPRRFKTKARRK